MQCNMLWFARFTVTFWENSSLSKDYEVIATVIMQLHSLFYHLTAILQEKKKKLPPHSIESCCCSCEGEAGCSQSQMFFESFSQLKLPFQKELFGSIVVFDEKSPHCRSWQSLLPSVSVQPFAETASVCPSEWTNTAPLQDVFNFSSILLQPSSRYRVSLNSEKFKYATFYRQHAISSDRKKKMCDTF